MSKRLFVSLIVALVLLMTSAVAITLSLALAPDEFKQEIEISSSETQTQVFEINALTLKPSDEITYTFLLKNKASGHYISTFAFAETTDGGLKQFVDVKMTYNGQTVTHTLSELFDGMTVSFDCTAKKKENLEITLTFSMSASIGNEAQDTSCDFNVIYERTQG